MINTMEFLKMPAYITMFVAAIFFVVQVADMIISTKKKIIPEFISIKQRCERKKKEREALEKLPNTISEVKTLLNDVNQHYSADNITKRDNWIAEVDTKLNDNANSYKDLKEDVKDLKDMVLNILVESKREAIVRFAERVVDDKSVSREQFERMLKVYQEYEVLVADHQIPNNVLCISVEIINEAYKKHLQEHSFLEDKRRTV